MADQEVDALAAACRAVSVLTTTQHAQNGQEGLCCVARQFKCVLKPDKADPSASKRTDHTPRACSICVGMCCLPFPGNHR